MTTAPTDRPAPPRVLFGSFDAERSWEARGGRSALPSLAPGPAAAALAGADELLLQLCGPRDLLLTGRPMVPELLADLRSHAALGAVATVPGDPAVPVEERLAAGAGAGLGASAHTPLPYAVLPVTPAAVAGLGGTAAVPEPAAVLAVNAKTWANAFCAAHGVEGAARTAGSAEELEREVGRLGYPVVLKSAHGVAGRGSMVVTDALRLGAVLRYQRARAADRGEPLLVQRLYQRAADFSAHFDLAPDGSMGEVAFRGMTNTGLSFAGSDTLDERVEARLRADDGYLRVLAALGAELGAAGYWGPVCVDGLIATDGTLVPVLDVNARLSMGRIALALDAAAPTRLTRLSFAAVRCSGEPRDSYLTIRRMLAEAGLAVTGDRGHGVRVLTAATLRAPVGRCYYVVQADTTEQVAESERRLRELLAQLPSAS
ncbi:hypothetical protein [Kitasatospora viridis]|uniref:Carbamoyl-phosphate synthase L subunit-like protein n=1 Tax=Kitasatospora viridis TaxID=281105 RepID=A0A561UHV4_9ACTN|nr:hypothetical protein [Kitasatospora viridis]TWF98925.1 carbamoyl-phosphate synthase L subunit-like protein [Kitasatospora viridis]